jgi:hypothetical protein
MKNLHVVQGSGDRLKKVWVAAGLHPAFTGAGDGAGPADFEFPDEAERASAAALAGDDVLWGDEDEPLGRWI